MKGRMFLFVILTSIICSCKQESPAPSKPSTTSEPILTSTSTSTTPSNNASTTNNIPPANNTPPANSLPLAGGSNATIPGITFPYSVLAEEFPEGGTFIPNGNKLTFFGSDQVVIYDELKNLKKTFQLDLVKTLNLQKGPTVGSLEPSVYGFLFFKTPTRTYVAFTAYYFKVNKYVEELYLGMISFEKGFEFIKSFPSFKMKFPINYTIGASYGEIIYIPIETTDKFYAGYTMVSYDPLYPDISVPERISYIGKTNLGDFYSTEVGANRFVVTTDKKLFTNNNGSLKTYDSNGVLINSAALPQESLPVSLQASSNENLHFFLYQGSQYKFFKADFGMIEKASTQLSRLDSDEIQRNPLANGYRPSDLGYFYSDSTLFLIQYNNYSPTISKIYYSDLSELQLKNIPNAYSVFYGDPNFKIPKRILGASGNCLYIISYRGSLDKMCTK